MDNDKHNDKPDALNRFIEKTRALFAEEADPEKRWTALEPILAELLADPGAGGVQDVA